MSDPIRVFASSFNCAKAFPVQDIEAQKSLIEQLIPHISHHDVYILGFQELVSIWEGSFPNVCLQYLRGVSKVVLERINTDESVFKCVDVNCLGGMGIMVFCRDEYELCNVTKGNVRCGAFYSSLKGATATKFTIKRSGVVDTITCLSSHLAANEGLINLEKRIQDYHAIMQSLREQFGDIDSTNFIFIGDLNFRLNKRFGDINYMDPDIISQLLEECDELKDVIKTGRAFENFKEAEILFPPTFKYNVADSNAVPPIDPLTYNFKRQPSWCDRILYSNNEKATTSLYKAIPRTPEFHFTDHQPVILSIELPHIEAVSDFEAEEITDTGEETNELEKLLPTSSVSSLSLSCGRIVDSIMGYSGWLYCKHPRWLLVIITLFSIYWLA